MEQKKNKSKLKIIIILLAIVIIAVMGIVIIKNISSNNVPKYANDLGDSLESIKKDSDNTSQENLAQIDINTENWKNYIELNEKEDNFYDDFGDLQYTTKYTEIKLKDNVYSGEITLKFSPLERNIYNNEIIMTIDKDNAYNTNTISFTNSNNSVMNEYMDFSITINDLKCINAKGMIFVNADT